MLAEHGEGTDDEAEHEEHGDRPGSDRWPVDATLGRAIEVVVSEDRDPDPGDDPGWGLTSSDGRINGSRTTVRTTATTSKSERGNGGRRRSRMFAESEVPLRYLSTRIADTVIFPSLPLRLMDVKTVDRIDVVSLAKVVGAIGFLWGVLVAIVWLVAGALGGPFPGAAELLVFTLGSPISGIVVGAITAILYNAAASLIGGLEFEVADGSQ